MNEWRQAHLGEVITLQRGFDLTEKAATPGPFPVISSSGPGYTTDIAKVEGPGVITGRKGVLGKVHFSPGPYWPHDTTLWVKDFKGAEPRFIYYLLQTLPLASLDAGASNPTLNRNHAHLLPVMVPGASVQARIAGILSVLDDLIENNRRRVELLEEMARAIYREWFVHLRYPGYESAKLIDSPLGALPEGWEVGRVDTHFVLQRGFDLPSSEREPGTVPVIGASGVQGFHSTAKAHGPGLTTGRSGTIGVVTYVPDDFWPLNTSLWVKEFRLSTPQHAYFLLSSIDLVQWASGAAVPTLNRNVVHALPAKCPPRSLIELWDVAATPMFDSMDVLRGENRRLGGLRDFLLPKLVSGQIDVSSLDLGALLEESVA